MGNKIKKILKKIRIKRTTVLLLAFVFMSSILVRELFNLQIIQGQDYINKFESRTTKNRVLKSTRGKIFDRNGVELATNILSYSVTFEDNGSYASSRERNLTLNGVAYQVLKILEKNGDTISHSFHIFVNNQGEYAFDVSEGFTLNRFKADIYGYPLIDSMKEEEKNATAQEMIEHMCGADGYSIVLEGDRAYTEEELLSHHLPLQLTEEEKLELAIIRYELSKNSYKKYMPVTIATNVSERSVAAIKENQSKLQGIEIVEDSIRKYVDEVSMGPILGYIGKASAEELETLREENPNYSNDAIIGKAGIEQTMELELQGTDGKETVIVDNLGKVLRLEEETRVDPVAGNDVYLTLDVDWQSAIYEILKQRVAGILLSKIEAVKSIEYEYLEDSSQIMIPIYDVYNSFVQNSVIDINKFSATDASDVEKNLYAKFQQKQQEVFDTITNRLTSENPLAFSEEEEEIQEYLEYICNDLLRDTLKIISKDAIDTSDKVYKEWAIDQSISMKEYLNYAASQSWIDISKISTEGEYLDSAEVYQALTTYLIDYLKTDTGFSKLLYKYMLLEDRISGQELCLVLYEQGVLSKDDGSYEALASGSMGAYDFVINKIWNLELEPAQLALMPCTASAVLTDVHTGDVIACVSYPGYDNNRLTNNMDTEYYAKLALDLSSPFFNKATQQKTEPGSTMKILSAITGLMEGVVTEDSYIGCDGSFDFVEPPINCWNRDGHGSLDVRSAIEQSCNYYFNMIGFQLGKVNDTDFSENKSLEVLQRYASMIGLDKKTGIEISEASPQVSNIYAIPSYMGQGTHLYTTSQLARYASTIANSGTVYDLTLLDKVVDSTGKVVEEFDASVQNTMDEVPQSVWDAVHEGMRRVVQTHEQFDDLRVDVAGKTGTAQIDLYHPDHGLFIGYAPYSEPEYAISVRIANGYTSGNACLAANDIFKYIFELDEKENIITGLAASDTSETSND